MKVEEIRKAAELNILHILHIYRTSDVKLGGNTLAQFGINNFEDGAKWALNHQWISVKDRIPSKDDDYVLCHLVNSDEIVSGYIGKNNQVETNPIFEFDAMGDYTCDYWMPIPKFKEE